MQVNREHRSLLAELQPSLEVISNNYPDEELCSLASELNICIATLGAVWSSEVKQRADVQVYRARKALKESMSESAQHESTKVQCCIKLCVHKPPDILHSIEHVLYVAAQSCLFNCS